MTPAVILDRLQAAGLTIRSDPDRPDRVKVAPLERLTPELRELILAHKPELLTELRSKPANASGTCGSCWHFRAAPGEAPDGRCARYGGAAWAALLSGCRGGWESRDPMARALERRRAKVVDRLRADPTLRYAFDAIHVPLVGKPSGPVSVMLGLRDGQGRIVTAELLVPADKWDTAAFLAYWDAQGRPS